jgi:hypothetical protein
VGREVRETLSLSPLSVTVEKAKKQQKVTLTNYFGDTFSKGNRASPLLLSPPPKAFPESR